MEKKLTTWEVLRLKFPANEFVLIEEVSDASGFSRSRSLDYMLINLWESRGLAITGIEQKSNRSDWLKELKNPQKQEKHFKYCDYFYLLTDREGVAKLEEIPDTWGWYHINEKRILKTMKAAPKLFPESVNRSFLCAMLRRAADKTKYVRTDSLETAIAEKAAQIHQERNYQQEMKAKNYDSLRERVDAFEKSCGICIDDGYFRESTQKLGEAVRLIKDRGLDNYMETLDRISKQVKAMYDGLEEKVKTISEIVSSSSKAAEGAQTLKAASNGGKTQTDIYDVAQRCGQQEVEEN